LFDAAATTEALIKQFAEQAGWSLLEFAASSATARKIKEAMRRLKHVYAATHEIPCCTPAERLPELPEEIQEISSYTWEADENTHEEKQKGMRWLQKHVCPAGVFVVPVQQLEWLDADFQGKGVHISHCKTDFRFFQHDEAMQPLRSALEDPEAHPNAEEVASRLRYVVGAYEAKTDDAIKNGIMAGSASGHCGVSGT
jgi:hypothetical protein